MHSLEWFNGLIKVSMLVQGQLCPIAENVYSYYSVLIASYNKLPIAHFIVTLRIYNHNKAHLDGVQY